jgi:hypothetical protein
MRIGCDLISLRLVRTGLESLGFERGSLMSDKGDVCSIRRGDDALATVVIS